MLWHTCKPVYNSNGVKIPEKYRKNLHAIKWNHFLSKRKKWNEISECFNHAFNGLLRIIMKFIKTTQHTRSTCIWEWKNTTQFFYERQKNQHASTLYVSLSDIWVHEAHRRRREKNQSDYIIRQGRAENKGEKCRELSWIDRNILLQSLYVSVIRFYSRPLSVFLFAFSSICVLYSQFN